jgi:hypothetical protein
MADVGSIGEPESQLGLFAFCPENADRDLARRLVVRAIERNGRERLAAHPAFGLLAQPLAGTLQHRAGGLRHQDPLSSTAERGI